MSEGGGKSLEHSMDKTSMNATLTEDHQIGLRCLPALKTRLQITAMLCSSARMMRWSMLRIEE